MKPDRYSTSPRLSASRGGRPLAALRVALLALVMAFGTACASDGGEGQGAAPGNGEERASRSADPEGRTASEEAPAARSTQDPPAAEQEYASEATSENNTTEEGSGEGSAGETGADGDDSAPIDGALEAELQGILDGTVADGSIPGAMLAVSTPGRETWYGSSGISDRTTGAPMDPDEPYRIASITKTFTATVVLQLAEEGRVDLDAPITTYLPDLDVPHAGQMTVRMLLNHTTGLYNHLGDPTFFAGVYSNPDRVWEQEELIDYATSFGPVAAPGEAWSYSSTGYVILGLMVEEITGNPYASELRTRILEPLGMDRTFFPPDEALPEELPTGYFNAEDHSDNAVSAAWATSNMVSTQEDMQRFGRALFEGDLLQPETREQMYEFVPGNGEYDMPDLAYGLGVMRHSLPVGANEAGGQRPPAATTAYGHIGGYGGFRTALWRVPERDITITIAVNQFVTDPNTIPTQALDAVLTAQGE
jgi:D-alanyl-D-alanine carboxypeptidase